MGDNQGKYITEHLNTCIHHRLSDLCKIEKLRTVEKRFANMIPSVSDIYVSVKACSEK